MPRNFLPSLRSPQQGNLYGYFLPKGLIHLSIKLQDKMEGKEVFLQIHKVKHVPDPDHYYSFSYRPSGSSDDDIVVKYGPNGFLSEVHTQIDDQTDEILTSLADILGTLGDSMAPTKLVTNGMKKSKTRSANAKELFEGFIDPFAKDDMEMLNQKIQAELGSGATFEARILGNQESNGVKGDKSDVSGIFAKPRALVELGIFSVGGKETEIVEIPHPHILEFIEIPTASFVKTEFEMVFSAEGYPTSIQIKKPSSALALFKMPVSLLKAVFEIPASIFQFRVNINNMKSQAIKSDYDYKKAVIDYANRLKSIENQNENQPVKVIPPSNPSQGGV
ncbi:MAG: hypothetical protein MRZ79_07235 [Bacteroidia bacterium]|nr:hypothetical protein [Bacteroidia bacterium]